MNINEKWEEVLDLARQHATKQGLGSSIKPLEDAYNEYLDMTDNTSGYGMGGQPGSQHNRKVLSGKIALALGNGIGGRHILNDEQLTQLKETLRTIVNNGNNNSFLK